MWDHTLDINVQQLAMMHLATNHEFILSLAWLLDHDQSRKSMIIM